MDEVGKTIKKFIHEWKQTIFWGVFIVFAFFVLRLINLTIVPVFADEAIYIRWAQVMKAEPTLRFLPLSDGKQPLFMWLIIPFLKFIRDPLVAGRFVSILSGFGTMVGLFLLSLKLFKSKRTALISSLLYAIIPFTIFFDRMALADSLLAMFGVWILLLSVLLVNYFRLDLAMILGIVLGGSFLTKSPSSFFALLLPFSSILISFKSKKDFLVRFFKYLLLLVVVYFFTLGIYNVLRLGPNFDMIALRNKDYVFPLSNVLYHPFDPFWAHIKEIWQWYGNLLTWPVFLSGLLGVLVLVKKDIKKALLILGWILIPLLIQSEYAKVFTARYVLYPVPLFLLLAAVFLDWLCSKATKPKKIQGLAFLLGFLLIIPLRYDEKLLTNPLKSDLPKEERTGYFEDWTAGYGIKEAAEYLKQRSGERRVFIGTEGYFGTLPDGLQIYLEKVPNITITGVGVNLDKVPDKLTNSLIDNEVYLLINDDRLKIPDPEALGLKLVASYPKATRTNGTNQNLLLFLVNPIQTR